MSDVTLSVTVQALTTVTAHFSGKLTSATKMSGVPVIFSWKLDM